MLEDARQYSVEKLFPFSSFFPSSLSLSLQEKERKEKDGWMDGWVDVLVIEC